MTADQMPELDKCPFCENKQFGLHVAQEKQRKTVTCMGCGASAGINVWNTRATPPKSQGVIWENVVELCHALTLARGIISVWCKDAPKENLSDWDRKWEASNKALVTIQEATRQHPRAAATDGVE